MSRTVADQPSLWEAILPDELRRLPAELARVDALFDDPVFFAPLMPFFDPRIGRPSTPMETYLRLMFLKFRYRLGFESLCREVSDSLTWRQFWAAKNPGLRRVARWTPPIGSTDRGNVPCWSGSCGGPEARCCSVIFGDDEEAIARTRESCGARQAADVERVVSWAKSIVGSLEVRIGSARLWA